MRAKSTGANCCADSPYFKVHAESRIEEAHVNFGLVEDEPVTPFRRLPKLEVDDDTVIRQIFCPYQPVQDPHEEVRIEVLVAEITTGPLIPPSSQRLDYRTESPACVCEVILEPSSV